MLQFGGENSVHWSGLTDYRPAQILSPGPGIAKPQRREQLQRSGFRAAVANCDADEYIFVAALCVLRENIEVAVFMEHPGVEEFEFRLAASATPIFVYQCRVWEFRLRILVKHPHVAVGRRRVEIEIIFLHIFAVVAFISCQSKEPLFQNRIAAVPHGEREADHLVTVADSRDAVFAPSIGARTRLLVRKRFPRGPARAVIFTDRSPLTFRKIGPPALPIFLAGAIVFQADIFGGLKSRHERDPRRGNSTFWSFQT